MKLTKQDSLHAAEAELGEVLKNFRSSVHAWSDAEFVCPRAALALEHRRTWRRAAVWALGCVLAAGSLSAGLYEHYRTDSSQPAVAGRQAQQPAPARLQQAAVAAAPATAQNTAAPAATGDEQLMATVDRDVSREVPSAMEPLAQLMDEGSSQ